MKYAYMHLWTHEAHMCLVVKRLGRHLTFYFQITEIFRHCRITTLEPI